MSEIENTRAIKTLQASIKKMQAEINVLKEHDRQKRRFAYTNAEMMDLLGVSAPTLRLWRRNKIIGYSQHGKLILYSIDDCKAFLKRFHVKDSYFDIEETDSDIDN